VTGTFSALSITNGSSSSGVTLSSQGHGGYGDSGTGYNALRSNSECNVFTIQYEELYDGKG